MECTLRLARPEGARDLLLSHILEPQIKSEVKRKLQSKGYLPYSVELIDGELTIDHVPIPLTEIHGEFVKLVDNRGSGIVGLLVDHVDPFYILVYAREEAIRYINVRGWVMYRAKVYKKHPKEIEGKTNIDFKTWIVWWRPIPRWVAKAVDIIKELLRSVDIFSKCTEKWDIILWYRTKLQHELRDYADQVQLAEYDESVYAWIEPKDRQGPIKVFTLLDTNWAIKRM